MSSTYLSKETLKDKEVHNKITIILMSLLWILCEEQFCFYYKTIVKYRLTVQHQSSVRFVTWVQLAGQVTGRQDGYNTVATLMICVFLPLRTKFIRDHSYSKSDVFMIQIPHVLCVPRTGGSRISRLAQLTHTNSTQRGPMGKQRQLC